MPGIRHTAVSAVGYKTYGSRDRDSREGQFGRVFGPVFWRVDSHTQGWAHGPPSDHPRYASKIRPATWRVRSQLRRLEKIGGLGKRLAGGRRWGEGSAGSSRRSTCAPAAAERTRTSLGGRPGGACKEIKRGGDRNPLATTPATPSTPGQLKIGKSGGRREFPLTSPPLARGYRAMLSW